MDEEIERNYCEQFLKFMKRQENLIGINLQNKNLQTFDWKLTGIQ